MNDNVQFDSAALSRESEWREASRVTGHYIRKATCSGLTNRSSGRVKDKVPSPYVGERAAQLSR
jgi:hypothetical protein